MTPRVRAVAKAQKLVLYAIALNLVLVALRVGVVAAGSVTSGTAGTVLAVTSMIALVTLLMELVGVYWLASALGYGIVARIVCLVLMFVPLVSLITLLVLNSRAVPLLRAAGLKVGLLGARW